MLTHNGNQVVVAGTSTVVAEVGNVVCPDLVARQFALSEDAFRLLRAFVNYERETVQEYDNRLKIKVPDHVSRAERLLLDAGF